MDKSSQITLLELLERICKTLEKNQIVYALAGGIPADLYRGEPRATDDIDLLVAIDEDKIDSAKEILQSLGYVPAVATEGMLKGGTRFKRKSKKGTPQIIVGRNKDLPYGIDFLLLSFPWAEAALQRAQSNLIGISAIGRIPCLTVEDMIISKLYAIKNNPTRRYKKSDIPDVALMLENNADIDVNYLSNAMETFELILPKGVEEESHAILSRVSKKLRKKNRCFDY